MTIHGTFRIYFSRHRAAPLVWCVATDTFELAVADLLVTAPLRAVYRPKATPDDEDGKPSAWLECEGMLTLRWSTAVIAETRCRAAYGAIQCESRAGHDGDHVSMRFGSRRVWTDAQAEEARSDEP